MPTGEQPTLGAVSPIRLFEVALAEAQEGVVEGGVPIGAALFTADGTLLGKGRNRLVQDGDPSAHAEIDAFRRVGRRGRFDDLILATTLMPCWMCAGMIRQFRIPRVVVGDRVNFDAGTGGLLEEAGVEIIVINDARAIELLATFMIESDLLAEDAGGELD